MSTLNAERLYALLPSVYRVRDAQEGYPLRDLVGLIAGEFEALEENIEQLYDDQFIETCAEWVAPYIGDLIGYRPLHGVVPKVASPRAEVANTIGYRRRKGTAAMLEQLARDVTGWPARAAEFFEQLATTQYMNHTRLHAQATADLRSLPKMLHENGPFNTLAHTAEMRRPETGAGRYNIPNVGIFLWRLLPMPVSSVPLTADPADATGTKFRFNPLGADQPLFRHPQPEPRVTHIAEPSNVPAPLRVRELALQFRAAQDTRLLLTQTDDYGPNGSFALYRAGAVVPLNRVTGANTPSVPLVRMADLRDVANGGWAHQGAIQADEIYIDPERGRVLLGSTRATEHAADPFVASYHRGFSREMAGGEYERTLTEAAGAAAVASGGASFQAALNAAAAGGRVVVNDSLHYRFTPSFRADGVVPLGAASSHVVVAADNGVRPVITSGATMDLAIGPGRRLVLEGLVIAGGALRLPAAADSEPRELVLRHCTLVPGLALNRDGSAVSPGVASLRIEHPNARLVLQDCIVGSVQAHSGAEIAAEGCIFDACSPEGVAFEGLNPGEPGGPLRLEACTVIGKLHTRVMLLASNSLFFARLRHGDTWSAPVWADRRQDGCVRFSFVPEGSLLPGRYHCVPDEQHPQVLPHFTSLRYADPGYAQLRMATDLSIRQGAEDGGEMGAMNALAQPQRETNLRLRLDEYLRFGLHAGFFYVT